MSKDSSNFWFYVFGAFIAFAIIPNLLGLNVESSKPDIKAILNTDEITIEYASLPVNLKINSVTKKYDINNNIYYEVDFRFYDYTDRVITCNIPREYAGSIDKDAVYESNIEIAYAKEYYNKIVEVNGYEDINSALKISSYASELSDVNFIFSEYIVTDNLDKDKASSNVLARLGIEADKESEDAEEK